MNPSASISKLQKTTRGVALACALVALLLPAPLSARESRSQVIDFEDDMIRGVSKQPYDSLNQISDKDKNKNRAHLYRKRAGYRYETRRSLRELRLIQP